MQWNRVEPSLFPPPCALCCGWKLWPVTDAVLVLPAVSSRIPSELSSESTGPRWFISMEFDDFYAEASALSGRLISVTGGCGPEANKKCSTKRKLSRVPRARAAATLAIDSRQCWSLPGALVKVVSESSMSGSQD